MLKIINVPKDCVRIEFIGITNNSVYFVQKMENPYGLEEYVEPKTADGLTLSEFIEKGINNKGSIEYYSPFRKQWDVTCLSLKDVVYDMCRNPKVMSKYRIKSTLVHYTQENIINLCGKTVNAVAELSNNKSKVTCPDCLKILEQIKFKTLGHIVLNVSDEIARINKINI